MVEFAHLFETGSHGLKAAEVAEGICQETFKQGVCQGLEELNTTETVFEGNHYFLNKTTNANYCFFSKVKLSFVLKNCD